MYSGIVETLGIITHLTMKEGCQYLTIAPQQPFTDIMIGDSIAINGVCLTVTDFTNDTFNVTAVPETLRLTNLAELTVHSEVNLERSLKIDGRLGGHYVQGHIDGKGEILELKPDNSDAWLVKISLPESLAKYVVKKGYIAIDGMSITVIDVTPHWFTVTFIPHTQAVTVTKHYRVGGFVNLEVDMMGKYIEKLLGGYTHAIADQTS